MSNHIATRTDDAELHLDSPIDDFTMQGFMYNAKATCRNVDHRLEFILDENDNIMKNVIESITDGKIHFLTLGFVLIKNDINVPELGVCIFGKDKPICHDYFRTFYYDSFVTTNGTDRESIKDAFDRLEKALDIVTVASFGAEISYYVGIPHVNLFICKEMSSELITSNICHLNEMISKLGSKLKNEFTTMYSLIGRAQRTSSPYESFLMTWNAADIACSMCDKIFGLKEVNVDIDISQIFSEKKPKSIAEARAIINDIEANNTQRKWERVFRYVFRENTYYAEYLLDKCFRRLPQKIRLYNIRNKIAHGGIVKDRATYWKVCYRLSELNEFAPLFAMLAPFDKNALKKKSDSKAENTPGGKALLMGTVLNSEGLPAVGDKVTITEINN